MHQSIMGGGGGDYQELVGLIECVKLGSVGNEASISCSTLGIWGTTQNKIIKIKNNQNKNKKWMWKEHTFKILKHRIEGYRRGRMANICVAIRPIK